MAIANNGGADFDFPIVKCLLLNSDIPKSTVLWDLQFTAGLVHFPCIDNKGPDSN